MIRIPRHQSVAVLTGAGISVSSGLAPFRGPGGIWNDLDIEAVATAQAWQRNPDRVRAFVDQMRRAALAAAPAPAHLALARAEHARIPPASFDIITQNVDGIHRRAGSTRVHEIHGSLHVERCEACGHRIPWPSSTRCTCGGTFRPHVVLFGEMLPEDVMTEALHALQRCHWFVAIGTSGVVSPAASFVLEARASGATCINVNIEPSGNRAFDEELIGPADEIVPGLFAV